MSSGRIAAQQVLERSPPPQAAAPPKHIRCGSGARGLPLERGRNVTAEARVGPVGLGSKDNSDLRGSLSQGRPQQNKASVDFQTQKKKLVFETGPQRR